MRVVRVIAGTFTTNVDKVSKKKMYIYVYTAEKYPATTRTTRKKTNL